jgi:hypothetical protein
MSEAPIYIALAISFAALLVWLFRPRRRFAELGRGSMDQTLASVAPNHYQYFPQIRQALSDGDHRYLLDKAPSIVAKQVIRERRAVARKFLSGLHEDFSKLELLARMVAALSPVVSQKQEAERLVLGLRFRVLYGLVCLRLLVAGRVPLLQIERLAGLVGRLALRMEQAMAEINALSTEGLPRGINA